MKSPAKVLLTAGLGAVAMYYLDPVQGRKRRDLARDSIEYGRDRLEKVSHTARVVGHDVGNRADRTLHGLRTIGHDLGERAASAVSSPRSLFGDRHSSRHAGVGPLKLAGIPVSWLCVAGIAASVTYLFDPSQGIYRRARLRSRLGRRRTADSTGREAANDTDDAGPMQAARQVAGDGSRPGKPERPLPG